MKYRTEEGKGHAVRAAELLCEAIGADADFERDRIDELVAAIVAAAVEEARDAGPGPEPMKET